jgi:clorobiocin biosynthesis protein CloN7
VSNSIRVPGARLTYDVTGSGPVLFLVGTPMDAAGFAPVVPHLADEFTVVTFDPRGIGRSTVADPAAQVAPATTAEDVHAILAEVTDEPAYVLGSSGGAIGALALVGAHGDRVRTLVAHEPPLTSLLPDAEAVRTRTLEIVETCRTEGWGAAMGQFLAMIGVLASMPADAPPMEMTEQMAKDSEFFLRNYLRTVSLWEPDLAAVEASSTRVVVGAGRTSAGQLAHRTAAALAEALRTELTLFPGDHGGFASDPEAFATELRKVLVG